jgi:hypothetical protein
MLPQHRLGRSHDAGDDEAWNESVDRERRERVAQVVDRFVAFPSPSTNPAARTAWLGEDGQPLTSPLVVL